MEQEGGEEPRWTHLLVSDGHLDDVQQPIMASSRIRYTCISVSKKFIALGSSTGVVHIFIRESLRYVQLIPGDKDGSVVKVKIGPDESSVGFATSKGMVYVYQMKMDRRLKPEKLRSSNDHRGTNVTSLAWNDQGNRLFIGDDFGKVTAANVVLGPKDLFKTPSETIMNLDKPVIQIDSFRDLILVSTTERTFIGNSVKKQYTHIGSKLRDGHFGACFWRPVTSGGEPMIYCSRPGSRIWECSAGGKVLNTHQFKSLLAVPPLPLVLLKSRYLVTMNECGIYVFDPIEVKIILWNDEVKNAADWSCQQSTIYVLGEDGGIQKLELSPTGKVVAKLVKKEKWKTAAQICLTYDSMVRSAASRQHVPVVMVTSIKNRMEADNLKTLADDIAELLPKLEDFLFPESQSSSSQSSRRSSASYEVTESGIYIVKNRSDSLSFANNVLSFWGQAEKVLDNAFTNGDTSKDFDSAPWKISSDAPAPVQNSNGGSNEFLHHKTPQVEVNGINRAENGDTIETGSAAEEDSAVLEPLKENLIDLPPTYIAEEAEIIEDFYDDDTPVIARPGTGMQKSKSRKLKSARLVLEESDHKGPDIYIKEKTPSVNNNMKNSANLPNITSISRSVSDAHDKLLSSNDTRNETFVGQVEADLLRIGHFSSGSKAAELTASRDMLNVPESSSRTIRDLSPKRGLLKVKDKLSGTVKTKTKSLIQTIKEKKSKISPPKLLHKNVEDVGTLIYHRDEDDDSDKYYIQALNVNSPDAKGLTELEVGLPPRIVDCHKLEDVTDETFRCVNQLSSASDGGRIHELLLTWVNTLHETFLDFKKHQEVYGTGEPVPLALQNGIELVTDFDIENSSTENCNSSQHDAKDGDSRISQMVQDEKSSTFSFGGDDNQEMSISKSKPAHKRVISLNDSTYIPLSEESRVKASQLACYCLELETYGDIQSLAAKGENLSDCDLFLKMYYYLLEPHLKRIWKGLQKKETLCEKWRGLFSCVKVAYASNKMMLKLNQSNAEEIVTLLKPSIDQLGPELLVYLDKLYAQHPSEMVRFVSTDARDQVLLSEVLHIINSHCLPEKKSHLCEYLEYYIDVEDKNLRLKLLQNIVCDLDLTLTLCEKLLLEKESVEDETSLKCSCGMPSPRSHGITLKSEDLVFEILSRSPHSSQLMELCYKHGFWKGYLSSWMSHHRSGSHKEKKHILPVILQLDDMRVFDQHQELLPNSDEEWIKLLHSLQKIKSGGNDELQMKCHECGSDLKRATAMVTAESVTWENICNRMVQSLGPEVTLKLLSDFRSPQGRLSLEFYTKCVTTAHVNAQQRQIIQEISDKMYGYLSSQLPSTSSQEVSFSFDEVASEASCLAQTSDSNRTCAVCGLGLEKTISLMNSEVSIFPCGHAFHDCCLEFKGTCPGCDSE